MERYNTQDHEVNDYNKIDIVQPTPKRPCTRTSEGCIYCMFDAPHPSITLSDWSSEDWDDKKAKAKEQRALLDFKLLEQQLQKTLQDTPQDTTQDTDKQETDLINGMQDLTLDQKPDKQNKTDILAPPLGTPGAKYKELRKDNPTTTTYSMTDQEVRLQHEEEKYGIYMSTFSYEGDDSNLDSEMGSDSNAMAYLFHE